MKLTALFCIAYLLSGCAGLGEVAAAPGQKDANVTCVTYDTLPMDAAVLHVNIDKGVVEDGELDVKCGANTVKFTNKKAVK